jgi:hypothetical protein
MLVKSVLQSLIPFVYLTLPEQHLTALRDMCCQFALSVPLFEGALAWFAMV